tara:strand:- start:20448 stop:21098 length:651 start_codon:yes stop_codon:yes gene_type:complete
MKQIIILLLIIIASIIGYGKYSDYKRYNAPEVNYRTEAQIDVAYHNQVLLLNYNEAIEDLNGFVMLQWTANEIDVRTPEDDNLESKNAVEKYAKKLAKVRYYQAILENSLQLKEKGLSNTQIKFIEEKGIDLETYHRKLKYEKIKSLLTTDIKLYNGSKNAIIYEVQKELNNKGYQLTIDGVYRIETLNAIKKFEESNNLLADGLLDDLTVEMIFQ